MHNLSLIVLSFLVPALGPAADLKAPCSQSVPNLQEMRLQLAKLSQTAPLIDRAVGGHFMNNENARLINSYRALTSFKDWNARSITDIDYWSIFKNGTCDKALCAAEKIYGAEAGQTYLYVSTFYGFNLSTLGYDKLRPPTPQDALLFKALYSFRPWQLDELHPYQQAMANLPRNLLPFADVRLTHAGIVNPINPNILSNGLISVYSVLDTKSDFEKETTLYHEFGHNLRPGENIEISEQWLTASGWFVEEGKLKNNRPQEFVTEYAKKNLFEDFAETFLYYRYFPAVLKEKSPARYQYMKIQIYGEVEYLNCPSI